jgi:hypothetical protein
LFAVMPGQHLFTQQPGRLREPPRPVLGRHQPEGPGLVAQLQGLVFRHAAGMAQHHRQPQAQQLLGKQLVAQGLFQLAQLAALAQHQLAHAVQLGNEKPGASTLSRM